MFEFRTQGHEKTWQKTFGILTWVVDFAKITGFCVFASFEESSQIRYSSLQYTWVVNPEHLQLEQMRLSAPLSSQHMVLTLQNLGKP